MSALTATGGKLTAISDLIRLPRQQGTLLVLWPTLWSLFIASGGRPSFKLLAIFVLGTFLMRSAGCAINDFADRKFDPRVERTRTRPLADGRLRPEEALMVFAALSALAFILVLFLNTFTIMLSVVALLLASVYPFVKRVSHLPQAVLGMAFGWGAVMAWGAVHNELSITALAIFVANIFWSMSYDTIYALMDKEDDLKIGVKSTAILFGRFVYGALVAMYVIMALLLVLAGSLAGLGLLYYSGIAVASSVFLYMVWTLKKEPTRQTAYRAFTVNALVGGVVLFFTVADMNF